MRTLVLCVLSASLAWTIAAIALHLDETEVSLHVEDRRFCVYVPTFDERWQGLMYEISDFD